ncbi:MAG TPA: cysteine synthase family protein [Candidatus Thermoplasmatota archaeon]|nr:cysteine synthase family protein [Candidatus Thermoplasmatota archaeon]
MVNARSDPSTILGTIGDTPLLELTALRPPGGARVVVKIEGANPTGSMKDRMALAMIEGARREGRLAPGHPVVELTGGSTGTSLALVCRALGHPLSIVTNDAVAREKIDMTRALGARVEVIRTPEGKVHPGLVPEMRARVEAIVKETGAFWTDQFNNAHQVEGYATLAAEVLRAEPDVTHFVHIVGTAGSSMGVSKALRAARPGVGVRLVEPASSPWLTAGRGGSHGVEGTAGVPKPPLLQRALYDDVVAIDEQEGRAMARQLAREEGVFAGTSTGLNVVAALQLAATLPASATVLTIAVDTGLKYLAGDLYRFG